MNTVKILLVEDHMVVRNGIKLLLESHGEFKVIGEASDGTEALAQLADGVVPDIVLTDVSMELMDGMELLKNIRQKYPFVKVVILSMLSQIRYVVEGFKNGLSGYLLKNIDYNELLFGLKHVAEGGRYISEEISLALLEQVSSHRLDNDDGVNIILELDLNERELEVLELIADGLTNLEIADKIFLSKRTVEGYRQNLLDKTKVKNTAELVKFAFQHGLLKKS
ncbi:response regulator [Sphingobacterium zeae]|uniref:DNA-binding NarL/FixJ family response regulator n=1 Tax=Sphingobacterium zeae TaxID=1776859 RepID=A0ABU0U6P4_9SPHI|nr:response regulator transcription factor [Sphingobacterium zeae]MDQ1150635.1 DNA-binding NarL/FixJ family response regulator [Sphingobacterium zeae]